MIEISQTEITISAANANRGGAIWASDVDSSVIELPFLGIVLGGEFSMHGGHRLMTFRKDDSPSRVSISDCAWLLLTVA